MRSDDKIDQLRLYLARRWPRYAEQLRMQVDNHRIERAHERAARARDAARPLGWTRTSASRPVRRPYDQDRPDGAA